MPEKFPSQPEGTVSTSPEAALNYQDLDEILAQISFAEGTVARKEREREEGEARLEDEVEAEALFDAL